jgi:signal transduction histidine kinase
VVKRAAALTRQLVAFSRKEPARPEVLSLDLVVSDVRGMLAGLIGGAIVLDVVLAEEGGTVKADRGQLEQVLLNLVVNARDAMPDGGRLRIATSEAALGPGASRHLGAQPPAATWPSV